MSVNVDGVEYSTEGTMFLPESTKGFYFDNLKYIEKRSEITFPISTITVLLMFINSKSK